MTFNVRFIMLMHRRVIKIEIGMENAMTRVLRKLRRKSSIISIARRPPCNVEEYTSPIVVSIIVVSSLRTETFTPYGRAAFMPSKAA